MNCAVRFRDQVRTHPERVALWTSRHGSTTFRELHELTTRAQRMFREAGVGPGAPVLLATLPSPATFAAICALLGLGAPILFVEPWLSVDRIDSLIAKLKPQAYFTGFPGRLWGVRVGSIRKIPHWLSPRDILKHRSGEYHLEELSREASAFVAFSSGTTGTPKGVLRTQGYLWDMHEIIVKIHPQEEFNTPDLAVFPNVTLFQLGTGRGAVLVPQNWKSSALAKLAALPQELRPETVTCGPAFLKRLLEVPGFERLRSIHVGGALTDRWIFEEAFARWPDAHFMHIYGGSEAEPVALQDAHKAVSLSRERGLFQTLSLGAPVDILQHRLELNSVWVSGPNVSPEYVGDPRENEGIKKRDADGRLWHCMGDRITEDSDGWWYAGRQFQSKDDFDLEQKLYALMRNSAAFVSRGKDGKLRLFGEKVVQHSSAIRKQFPEIDEIHRARIVRDRRHRARIHRQASLPGSFR